MMLIVTMCGFLGASLSTGATAFIGSYVATRFVLAGLFFASRDRHEGARSYARAMAVLILIGVAFSGSVAPYGRRGPAGRIPGWDRA